MKTMNMRGKLLFFLMLLAHLPSKAASVNWGTYFGGLNRDQAMSVCTDKWGNVYMVGNTASTSGISTPGSLQHGYGGEIGTTGIPGDAFIAKYSSTGRLLWATYYGGTDDEGATGVGCDTTGRIYVTGWTGSVTGIATTNSHQSTIGGGNDAFLLCLDTAGNRLWATYYGGAGDENSNVSGAIHVTSSGDVFIAGKTASPNNISTTGSHKPALSIGISDGYVAKFDRNGKRIWGTYYGNSLANGESTEGLAVFVKGSQLYVTGATTAQDGISTTGAYRLNYGGGTRDAFLARFDTSGNRIWGTYFGGASADRGMALLVDNNTVYLCGETNSAAGIATAGSHQPTIGGNQDLFFGRFDINGTLLWSTYFGGSSLDGAGRAMIADGLGNIYITGNAASTNGIGTGSAIQPANGGGQDAILAKFNSAGNVLWATYYGGSGVDYGSGLASDGGGIIYMAGRTSSANAVATAGSQQPNLAGDNDAMLIAINDCNAVNTPDTISGPIFICARSSATYRAAYVAGAGSYTWLLPQGWSGNSAADSISVNIGSTSGWLKVVANGICSSSDTQRIFISVSKVPVINPITPSICSGDSVQLIASNVSSNLAWIRNGSPVLNATDSVLFVNQSGSYSIISSEMGCMDTSDAAVVTVHPLPVVGNILGSGNTLSVASSFATYQWNFNGTPITGAVNSTFQFIVNGNYTVTVTDTNGCKATSPVFNTNTSSIANTALGAVQVYPTLIKHGTLYIEAFSEGKAWIYALDGKILRQQDFNSGKIAIDVSSLPTGIYYLKIAGHGLQTPFQTKITIQ